MTDCSKAAVWTPLYIDNELGFAEIALLEAHLQECQTCRDHFDQLRAVVDNIRAAAPLYEPSSESLKQVHKLVMVETRAMRYRRIFATAAVFAVTALAVGYLFTQRSADRFSDFAAAAHERYVKDAAPLDVVTDQPELVSRWFVRRLPFQFKVPEYVNEPGNPKRYSLIGARLLEYGDNDVAYLAYRMNERPISLLVASSRRVVPDGGQTFRTGGVDFHFSSARGLRLITWKDRALSYALVSDLEVTGAESCVICHGSRSDRKKIEQLPQ